MGTRGAALALALGLAVAASLAACWNRGDGATGAGSGNDPGDPTGSNGASADGTGTVGVHLDLAPGTSLVAVKWTISNATNTYFGVVEIGDAQSLEFVRGGIAAGSGYMVQLTAVDSHGDPCMGNSPTFTIAAGALTQTVLVLTCKAAPDGSSPGNVTTGTVEIDASILFKLGPPVSCPGISSFSISPAAITANQTAQLALETLGPVSQITWSVSPPTGGTFGNPNAAETTFECARGAAFVPQVTIRATVALDDAASCDGLEFTTTSAFVNCLGPANE
jgi:hypothetical protein